MWFPGILVGEGQIPGHGPEDGADSAERLSRVHPIWLVPANELLPMA